MNLLFRLLALGDVRDNRHHAADLAVRVKQARRPDIDVNERAVLFLTARLVIGHSLSAKRLGKALLECFASVFRNDWHRLIEYFARAPTERLLCRRIPHQHICLRIHHKDGERRSFDQHAQGLIHFVQISRALLDHFFQKIFVIAFGATQLLMFARTLDRRLDVLQVEGFRDVVERASAQSFDGALYVLLAANHDDHRVGRLLEHLRDHLKTCDTAHHDVTQNQIKALVSYRLQSFFA